MSKSNLTSTDIRNLLQDEQSFRVFDARKQWAENPGNATSIFAPVCENAHIVEGVIAALKRKIQDNKFVLYGAGGYCGVLLGFLADWNLLGGCIGIWESNPARHGLKLQDVEITAPAQVDFDYVIITPKKKELYEQIEALLIESGVSEDKIIIWSHYVDILCDEIGQYFDKDIILPRLQSGEIFIDGGSMDCETSKQFLRFAPNPGKIYVFECSDDNILKCKKAINTSWFDNWELVTNALWSDNTKLCFNSSASGNAGMGMVSDDVVADGVAIEACTLDSVIPDNEKVTFIKLDLEGAETEALRGAQQIIVRDKPKLAICIYHKPYDYIEIPEYIHYLVPEYKMYMRHYFANDSETVLYCVL